MQDIIQREIQINASQQRIYAAIADPALVVKWFPETLDGVYAVGERPIFGFGEHGRNQIYVKAAQPHHYFAYCWVPGSNHFVGDVLAVPHTLVEFRIEELSDHCCKLTLTESGFAQLPQAVAEKSYQQNCGGWDFMLNRLTNYFAGA